MASYALSRGKAVPAKALVAVHAPPPTDGRLFVELVAAHDKLAKVVSPARPSTIEALVRDGGSATIPAAVARLSKVLAFAVVAVLVLGTAHAALGFGTGFVSGSDVIDSLPHAVVANALFVALAALGASFHSLMTTQRRLDTMTFEARDVPRIWARLWLGVVAGVLMATYLDVGGNDSDTMSLSRPVLALLGGFGSDVVYRMLDGLVKALGAALERNVDDRLDAERTRSALALERATDEERRGATQNLLSIQRALASGSLDDARALVDSMLEGSSGPPIASKTASAADAAEAAQ